MKELTPKMLRAIRPAIILVAMIAVSAMVGCATGPDRAANPSAAPAVTAEVSDSSTRITGISVSEEADRVDVLIDSNRQLTYTSVKQPSPLGVVLYFPKTGLENLPSTHAVGKGPVDTIQAADATEETPVARIHITLNKDVPYDVARHGTGLKVSFPKAMASSSAPASETEQQPASQPETAAVDPAEKMEPATHLQQVNTYDTDRGTQIHLVADGTIADYKSFTVEDPTRVVFDIFGIESPYEKEKLIPINSKWVNRIRYYGHPDKVRLVVDLKPGFKPAYLAKQVKDGLTVLVGEDLPPKMAASKAETEAPAWVNRIDFLSEDAGESTIIIGTTRPVAYDLKKAGPKKLWLTLTNADLPDYRKNPLVTTRFESAVDRIIPVQTPEMTDRSIITIELREDVPYMVEEEDNLVMIHFEASTIPPKPLDMAKLPDWQQVMAETAKGAGAGPEKQAAVQYSGERIALDFFETDIKNVFRILKEVSGKNFAIDDDVTGKVTLSFDKPVPWDRVFELVLKMNKLGKIVEGEIIRITTQQTLDDEEAKQLARMQTKPLETEYILVNYARARAEVEPLIKEILSDRGKISVNDRTNQIIMTDIRDNIERAKDIVKQVDKVTPQVMIEARIVEAFTSFDRSIGIGWSLSGGPQDFLGSIFKYGGIGVNPPPGVGNLPPNSFGFRFAKFLGSPIDLDMFLRAEENSGQIQILSSPKVSTANNVKAIITQGEEYPYLERDEAGLATVQFKQIPLKLEVTPQITNDDRVVMTIKITKKDIQRLVIIGGSQVPALATHEAETVLLVNNGDTIVIGGIIRTRVVTGETGFPWLSKIPILGWLFKARADQKQEVELMVFIRPRIIELKEVVAKQQS